MLGLMVLDAECGIEIPVELFERVSSLNQGSKLIHTYTSMRAGCKLILDFKSKVNNWDERYFFVKIDFASVLDVTRFYRKIWNPNMVRCFGCLVAFCN